MPYRFTTAPPFFRGYVEELVGCVYVQTFFNEMTFLPDMWHGGSRLPSLHHAAAVHKVLQCAQNS